DLFKSQLETCGDVALAACQLRALLSRGTEQVNVGVGINPADYRRAFIPAHVYTFRVMPEKFEIQPELSFVFSANYLAKLIDESWHAVRRETHDLSFVSIVWEPQKLSGRCVQDPCRVRIFNLAKHVNRVVIACGPHRRDEVAEAIDRQKRRTLKRRDVKTTGEMSAMMFDIVNTSANPALVDAEGSRQIIFQVPNSRGVCKAVADRSQKPASGLGCRLGRRTSSGDAFDRAGCRVQNLLVKVRGRIARDRNVLDMFN